MRYSKKRVENMLITLKDLAILDCVENSYKVTADFDLVIRGLIVKRLKRCSVNISKTQLQQIQAEALVDGLSVYGFLNITEKPTDVELAVNCLLTMKKGEEKP